MDVATGNCVGSDCIARPVSGHHRFPCLVTPARKSPGANTEAKGNYLEGKCARVTKAGIAAKCISLWCNRTDLGPDRLDQHGRLAVKSQNF